MRRVNIVRSRENKLHCFYYSNENGISKRTHENGSWGSTQILAPDARENYSLTLSDEGYIYIFFSDKAGNINFCTNSDGQWHTQLVLKNQSPIINTVIFYPIIDSEGLELIYNVPSVEERVHYLASQRLNTNGEWGAVSRIDNIAPLNNGIFFVKNINNSYMLVFYVAKSNDLRLGYREITNERCGNFNTIHKTNFQIIDYSFLTTNDAIHMLYIVKGMFSSQLIYKVKNSEGLSTGNIIWEGQRVNNCLLYYIKGTLYAAFESNNRLYASASYDNGNSFSRPSIYKKDFCQFPEKAMFYSDFPKDENNFYCDEVYVDRQNFFDIQILPDNIPDFYFNSLKRGIINQEPREENSFETFASAQHESDNNQLIQQNSQNQQREHIPENQQQFNQQSKQKGHFQDSVNRDVYDPFGSFDNAFSDFRNRNEKKTVDNRNKNNGQQSINKTINMLTSELNQKDTHIKNIANQLKYRDEEIALLQKNMRGRKAEIEELKKEIIELKENKESDINKEDEKNEENKKE